LITGLTPANDRVPSWIMPYFSITCAAALVNTVNRIKGRNFAIDTALSG